MFAHRNVTAEDFEPNDLVWVFFQGRIQRGVVYRSTGDVYVVMNDLGISAWCDPRIVFKRPTEYHLLQAAVNDLIDDLRRDVSDLLAVEC